MEMWERGFGIEWENGGLISCNRKGEGNWCSGEEKVGDGEEDELKKLRGRKTQRSKIEL
jgi:hypothetical protein